MTNPHVPFDAPFEFDYDHSQYMSLAGHETFIPPSLELRAKAALKELADIKKEFEFHSAQWDKWNTERESKFEDAMSHFTVTKDEWVRHEDHEGNIHWINTSYIPEVEKPLPFWPFGDTSDFY